MKIIINIIFGIGLLYLLSVSWFTLYFNYLYARDYGFIRWLLLGWIIPFLKAWVWPIIILID